MPTITEKIKSVAESYVGQEEIRGNKGFQNPQFQKKMKDCGWNDGQSWCAYFTELVWKEAYGKSSPFYATLDRLFSPSATATFTNFSGNTAFKTGKTPKVGALVVWRYGTGWQGHIGIVTEIKSESKFVAVEGNTNNNGSREGYGVFKKLRDMNFHLVPRVKGLNLIGFVYPA
jgi:hypothetical protein